MEDYSHLEKFIKENYAAICAVAMQFVDKDTAQDITQDVLFKFWENREKYKDVKSLDNFLFTMVKNEALSYLRSRKRENERYKELNQEEAEEQTFHTLVEEETRKEGLSRIRLTVNKHNTHAKEVYEHLGYETVESVKTDIGSGYYMDDFVMVKVG